MVDILDMIKTMNTETIQHLFTCEHTEWLKQAAAFCGKELIKDDEMSGEAISAFYYERTKTLN